MRRHNGGMANSHATSTESMAPVSFDPALIRKYDGFGPRYTSYPTADRFTEGFAAEQFVNSLLARAAGATMQPLSLYLHIPFCDTICYYCACNKVITKDHGRSENTSAISRRRSRLCAAR